MKDLGYRVEVQSYLLLTLLFQSSLPGTEDKCLNLSFLHINLK